MVLANLFSMNTELSMNPQRGFTLLEVMVALAVFATLSAAVFSASQFVLSRGAALEERLFATWLADNQLNELQLQSGLTPGRQRLARHFAQRDWWLSQTIERSPAPGLLKVQLSVGRTESEQPLQRVTSWLPVTP